MTGSPGHGSPTWQVVVRWGRRLDPAWPGAAIQIQAGRGPARHGSPPLGLAWRIMVGPDAAPHVTAQPGAAGLDAARLGRASPGAAGFGRSRLPMSAHGVSGLGCSGLGTAPHFSPRCGLARRSLAWPGPARQNPARHDRSGHGLALITEVAA